MEIHELNTKTLTDPAYVAFDDGTDTYKVEFNDTVESAAQAAVAEADLTQNTVGFTSGDSLSPSGWTSVSQITANSTLATLFNRISTMVKNVRYIWNLLGSSSFSNVASTLTGAIGNTALTTTAQTLSGAIAEHESDISTLNSNSNIPSYFLAMAANTNITIPVEPDSSLQISWFIGNEPKGIVLLRIPANSTLATLYLGDSSNIKPSISYGDGNLTIQNNASAFFRGIVLSTRKLSL